MSDIAQCAYCGKFVSGVHSCFLKPTLYLFVYLRDDDGSVVGAAITSGGEIIYMNRVRNGIYLRQGMLGITAKRWYNEKLPNGYVMCDLLDKTDAELDENPELMTALQIAIDNGP